MRRSTFITTVLLASSLKRTQGKQTMNSILNIYDNRAPEGSKAVSDWGFSVAIDYQGKKILFDSGRRAGIFKKNAETYGIDPTGIEMAFLSHDHDDHVNGFDYMLRVNPDFRVLPAQRPFSGRRRGDGPRRRVPARHEVPSPPTASMWPRAGRSPPACMQSPPRASWWAACGGTRRRTSLTRHPSCRWGWSTMTGPLTLISGCSHSTIENIVAEAKRASGREVSLVIGGFHTSPYPVEQVRKMARYLKDDLGVTQVAPTHCTGEDAIGVFREMYGKSFLPFMLGSKIDFA